MITLKERFSPYIMDPVFVAGIYHLYRQLYAGPYGKQLFYMTSGNSVGYFKYGGHIPWDDDLDLGFYDRSSQPFGDYLNFLESALKQGFLVNFYLRDSTVASENWWENKKMFSLALEHTGDNIMSCIRLREFLTSSAKDFYFANITYNPDNWFKLLKEVSANTNTDTKVNNSTDTIHGVYYWDYAKRHIVTPWIDVMVFLPSNDFLLESHFQPNNMRQPSLSSKWYVQSPFHQDTFGLVSGNFPIDLRVATIKFYKGCLDFNKFYRNETLYCHILSHYRLQHEYNDAELIEIEEIVREFNQKLLYTLQLFSPRKI